MQLADWIPNWNPTLQVWLVRGWNMAYNISVNSATPTIAGAGSSARSNCCATRLAVHRRGADLPELAWFSSTRWGKTRTTRIIYKFSGPSKDQRLRRLATNFEVLNPQTDAARAHVRLLREKYKMDRS